MECPTSRALVAALVAMAFCGALARRAEADYIMAEFDYFNEAGDMAVYELHVEKTYIAQTFLCERDGELTSVDLAVESNPGNNPAHEPLIVEIRSTYYANPIDGYLPTNTILAAATIAYDDPQFDSPSVQWVNVPMPACDLLAGGTYAVSIRTNPMTESAYEWWGRWTPGEDPYPDGKTCTYYAATGQFNFSAVSDLGFRINGVPEPGTVAVLALGGLAVIRRRRK
jgi:hypothetical protein